MIIGGWIMIGFEEIVPGIKLLRTPFGDYWSGVVLVCGRNAEDTVLIDSGANREVVDDCILPALEAEKIRPEQIGWLTCTHCHGDHVGGHYRIKELTGIRTAVYEGSADKIRNPLKYNKLIRSVFPEDSPEPAKVLLGVEPDRLMKEGELLAGRLRLIHTPGHDEDTVCWLDEKTNTLISGDSVQGSGAAGAGLAFYQDLNAYRGSLKRLAALQAENLLAAHSYSPQGASATGKEAVQDYLQTSMAVTERYDNYLSRWLTETPGTDQRTLARGLIREEGRPEPEYLFLERFTVRTHLEALKTKSEGGVS